MQEAAGEMDCFRYTTSHQLMELQEGARMQ